MGMQNQRALLVVCALAGVLQVAFISAASPVGSANVIFDATAAVLLGGTVLGGGVGGVGGTVIGVLFLGVLQNGLALAGIQSAWQQVISGAIVILAVLGQQLQRGRRPGDLRRLLGRSNASA